MKVLIISVLISFAVQVYSQGSYEWAKPLGEIPPCRVSSVAIDSSGAIYIAGFSKESTSVIADYFHTGTMFIAKYENNGKPVWKYNFLGNSRPFDIGVDREGDLLVAGGFADSLQLEDSLFRTAPLQSGGFLAKFSNEGKLLWCFGDTAGQYSNIEHDRYFVSVTTDNLNDIFLCGIDSGTVPMIAKYDAIGRLGWKRTLPTLHTVDDIIVSDNTAIYIAGTCDPGASLDGISVTDSVTANPYRTFLASLDGSGTANWLTMNDYAVANFANALALHPEGIIRKRYTENIALGSYVVLELYSPSGERQAIIDLKIPYSRYDQYIFNSLAVSNNKIFSTDISKYRSSDIDTLHLASFMIEKGVTPKFVEGPLSAVIGLDSRAEAIAAFDSSIVAVTSSNAQTLRFGDIVVDNLNYFGEHQRDNFTSKLSFSPTQSVRRDDHSDEFDVKVFPNPFVETIAFRLPSGSFDLTIHTVLGEEILHRRITDGSLVSLGDRLPIGTYYLTIRFGKQVVRKTLMRRAY